MDTNNKYLVNLYKSGFVFLIILSLFVGVKLLGELKSMEMMGSTGANTITLSGHGEVSAVPDIAGVYFTVESSKTTQALSSEEVNTKTQKILEFLAGAGVEEKDIKTEGYNSYPKYSNPQACPMYYREGGVMPPCDGGSSKIVGYIVSQSVSVKVRKVDDASKIIDGINAIGVTNMSGPNFTIDDADALQAQAREEAIADAKTKAEALAEVLGVRLGRVANFSEGGWGGPIMYGKAEMAMDVSVSSPAPAQLPQGENTITSDVSITYEIR